jgi:hypothetical protein
MKKEEKVMKRVIVAFQKVSNGLTIPGLILTVIACSGGIIWALTFLMSNPFALSFLGILLVIALFAIFVIFVDIQERKKLLKKIKFQDDLETQARHNRGEEPKITIRQKFSNVSNYELRIESIYAILKVKGMEIERFQYSKDNNINLDEDKLFFPEKIEPSDLDKAVEYRINDITKLAKAFPDYRKYDFLIEAEQAIEFVTGSTSVVMGPSNKIVIRPEDWKGGGQ